MKIEDINGRLELSYEMRLAHAEPITLHLIGAPGIGKSSVVKEFAQAKAEELGLAFMDFDDMTIDQVEEVLSDRDKFFVFVDMRLTGMDPIDASGIPRAVENKYVRFVPLDAARLLSRGAGVLFLDEFSNENRPNMQAASMKIVRDYKIGSMSLGPGVIVVAASNTPETSQIANSLPKPLRSRFDFVQVDPPSLEAWADWMDKHFEDGWDRTVYAYLKWKPSDFLANAEEADSTDNGIEPPADPRAWTYVGCARKLATEKITDKKMLQAVLEDMAEGKLGRVGSSFNAFIRNKIPSFDELMEEPEQVKNFKIEHKLLMSVTVSEALKESKTRSERLKKVAKFLDYIASKDDREFIVVLFTILPIEKRRALFKLVEHNQATVHALGNVGAALM